MKDNRTIEALIANVENALDELKAKLVEDGAIGGAVATAAPVPPGGPTPPNQK